MQWARFKAVYTENWIPAWTDDNLDIWIRDIERHDVEERLMLPCLQHMAANMAKRGETESPRMSHILNAYEAAQAEDARLTPSQNRPRRLCHTCGNSGYGVGLKNLHHVYVDPRNPRRIPGPLYRTLIPCTCPAYREEPTNPFPMAVRQQLAKYIIIPQSIGDSPVDDPRDESLLIEFDHQCSMDATEAELTSQLQRRR